MKVILSRKGMDSTAGGMDSPILPDGTLLSLPIPAETNGATPYRDLSFGDLNYQDLICGLKPSFPFASCHLDPDIYTEVARRPSNWVAAFGQSGAAASHLDKQSVSPGDLFLFFGRFRKAVWKNGMLKYERNTPAKHIVFGYLKVGKVLTDQSEIKRTCPWHPHAEGERKNNRLYLAERYGTFHLHEELVLTGPGQQNISQWSLPAFFSDPCISISYHEKRTRPLVNGKAELCSAGRGQEFVISARTAQAQRNLCAWAESILALD